MVNRGVMAVMMKLEGAVGDALAFAHYLTLARGSTERGMKRTSTASLPPTLARIANTAFNARVWMVQQLQQRY